MSNVAIFRIGSGQDVVGTIVSETETEYEIENVFYVLVEKKDGKVNLGMMPFWPFYAEPQKTISIPKPCIKMNPVTRFLNEYNQAFGSGIVIPEPSIVTE